jgi:hypothetical protein
MRDSTRRLAWLMLGRYIQKFYQMRTQLQAISLRIQVGGYRVAFGLAR